MEHKEGGGKEELERSGREEVQGRKWRGGSTRKEVEREGRRKEVEERRKKNGSGRNRRWKFLR